MTMNQSVSLKQILDNLSPDEMDNEDDVAYLFNNLNPSTYRDALIFTKSHLKLKYFRQTFQFGENNNDNQIKKIIDAFLKLDVSGFASLLEDGFDPMITNIYHNTIVHLLCMWGIITYDILKLFLAHPKYNPFSKNILQHTMLNILCQNATISDNLKCDIVTIIYEQYNIKKNDYCIFRHACENNNLKLIKLLLNHVKNNDYDVDYSKYLDCAFKSFNVDLLSTLFNDHKITSNQIRYELKYLQRCSLMDDDKTPDDRKKFIEFIFDNPRIEITNETYNLFLINAIIKGHEEIVSILLSYKTFSIDFSYESDIVFPSNILNILKILIRDDRFQIDFAPSIKTDNNRTLYHCLFISDTSEFTNLREINQYFLHELKYNPFDKDIFGATSLHYICRNGLYDIFMDIYEMYPNIDLNMSDNDGSTLLHYACSPSLFDSDRELKPVTSSRIQLINFLISHPSINLSKVDSHRKNIYHIACESPRIEILKLLFETCENQLLLNAINNEGLTPFTTIFTTIKHYNLEMDDFISCVKYLLTLTKIDFLKYEYDENSSLYHICAYYMYLPKSKGERLIQLIKYMIDNIDGIDIPNPNEAYRDVINETLLLYKK